MNRTDINVYLTNPELVVNASREDLRRLVETYPYCEALHWIYLRALYIADDAMFDEELILHGMHISNRRLFYNYLTYQNETDLNSPPVLGGEDSQLSILNSQLSTPDYFTLEQNQAQKQSLQQLAAQLKAARLARQKQKNEELRKKKEELKKIEVADEQIPEIKPLQTEEEAKKLIKEQKYLEAIEILRAISLNNPKKSANFALQIKFLETIINNHNKK